MLKHLLDNSAEKKYFPNTQDAFLGVSRSDTTAKKVIEVVKLIILMPWLLIIDSISLLNKKEVKRISFKEKLFTLRDNFFEKHRPTLIKSALVGIGFFAGISSKDRILELLGISKLPVQTSLINAKRILGLLAVCLGVGILRLKQNNPMTYINFKLKASAVILGSLDVASIPLDFNITESDRSGLKENIKLLEAYIASLKDLRKALKSPISPISWINFKLKSLIPRLKNLEVDSFLEGLKVKDEDRSFLVGHINGLNAEINNLKMLYVDNTSTENFELTVIEESIRDGTESLNEIIELIKKIDNTHLKKLEYQIEILNLFIKKLEILKLKANETIATDGHSRTLSLDEPFELMRSE